RKTSRRHLCRCAFVQGSEHHLGGHRRWTDLRHTRRRETLAERHAAAAEAVEQSFHYRSVALRCGNGVRGDQFIPARRFERAHLPHARLRQNVDGNYKRDSRWRRQQDRKSTRLNSSHVSISYAVFCLKKKNKQ